MHRLTLSRTAAMAHTHSLHPSLHLPSPTSLSTSFSFTTSASRPTSAHSSAPPSLSSCSAIVVVGARKLLTHGNKHTNRFATFRHYERLTEAVTHLKAQHFTLVGLELSADATELSTTNPPPFTPRTCFIPGNEGSGLSPTLLPHLDRLLYIRQSGCGTASLNVSVATGIVLYGFQQWAGYPEQGREGGEGGEAGLAKYRVDDEKAVGSGGWKIARQDTERHRGQGERQQGVVEVAKGEEKADEHPQNDSHRSADTDR